MRNAERSRKWKSNGSTSPGSQPPAAVATEPPPDSPKEAPPQNPATAAEAGKVTITLSLDAAVFLKYAVSKLTLSAGQPNLARTATAIEEIQAALGDVQVIAKG